MQSVGVDLLWQEALIQKASLHLQSELKTEVQLQFFNSQQHLTVVLYLQNVTTHKTTTKRCNVTQMRHLNDSNDYKETLNIPSRILRCRGPNY